MFSTLTLVGAYLSFNIHSIQSTVDIDSASLVGASLAGFELGTLLNQMIRKPKLENHPMCGRTTGGKEECWWDCEIGQQHQPWKEGGLANPGCLLDCGEQIHPCISSLIRDLLDNGVCCNAHLYDDMEQNDDCSFDDEMKILKGTCSEATEELLIDPACESARVIQSDRLRYTIDYLKLGSCSTKVFTGVRAECKINKNKRSKNQRGVKREKGHNKKRNTKLKNQRGRKKKKSTEKKMNHKNPRLPPIVWPNADVPFEHTRNRYPWVCSLRSQGPTPQHLCAVTLLSVPPKPTFFVGPAHCTYLCKKSENDQLDACCCADGPSEKCSEDKSLCGDNPKVFFMNNQDAVIICGEWNTRTLPDEENEEQYNVYFPIKEIVRHPNFTTVKGGGPTDGNDIAVFMVEDNHIDTNKVNELSMWPACLPLKKIKAQRGIHTGWSNPPSRFFVESVLPGFLPFLQLFSNQWHYSMDIMTKCEDPQKVWWAYNDNDLDEDGPLKYPTNTYYPPGTVCAKDFTYTSCFGQGDSGSPLMVIDKSTPDERHVAEGFLSFYKGCDLWSMGYLFRNDSFTMWQITDSPSVYTKISCFLPWIAKVTNMEFQQPAEAGDECLIGNGDPQDGKNEPCRAKTDWGLSDNPLCIFPYFYNGIKFEECLVTTLFDWVYIPRCPVRSIVKNGTYNSYDDTDVLFGIASENVPFLSGGWCPTDLDDPSSPLDPANTACEDYQRVRPFAMCNYNCPGVRAFGIIGGGAVLGFATSVGALGSFGSLGLFGPVAVGAFALGGIRLMCMGPLYCRVGDQCCLLVITPNGLRCPDSC